MDGHLADPHPPPHQLQQVEVRDDDVAAMFARGQIDTVLELGPAKPFGLDQRDLVRGVMVAVVGVEVAVALQPSAGDRTDLRAGNGGGTLPPER